MYTFAATNCLWIKFLIITQLKRTCIMPFKIDTKEKFHVIYAIQPNLPATLSDELTQTLLNYLQPAGIENNTQQFTQNTIIDLSAITAIDDNTANVLAHYHNEFYNSNKSFVICNANENIMSTLAALETELNIAPTTTEAWDIVQMEEIERELFNDEGV